MLICFYPGAGGNRYYFYIKNRFYQKFGIAFDNFNPDEGNKPQFRYLESDDIFKIDDSIPVLTHCLNIEKLQYHFPLKTKFVIIDSNFKASLRRQWCLNGMNFYNNDGKVIAQKNTIVENNKKLLEVKSAFATIHYHKTYYKNFQPTFFSYKNIDITIVPISANVNNEFSKFMHAELNLYSSIEFDYAWDRYEEHGPTFKILEMYEKKFL